MTRTLEIEESEYEALREAARLSGLSVEEVMGQLIASHRTLIQSSAQQPRENDSSGRFARLSQRIREAPPLQGMSHFLQDSMEELRDEFTLGSAT